MNMKNVFGIAVLIIAAAFAIQTFQQNQAEARQSATQPQTTSQSTQTIEFARLQFEAEDSVTWLIGGNTRVRTESVRATYRRMGGSGRGSFADLLNQIGTDGWNLLQKDDNVWIFSRRAS